MPGKSHCVLRTLENPMLNGILLGLEVKDDHLEVVPSLFPCCAGEGARFDAVKETMSRCGLPRRLLKAEHIFRCFQSFWGESGAKHPHLVSPQKSARILTEVAQVLKGNKPQGALVKGARDKPSDFYAMALACVWRFGIDVHFVNFSQTKKEHWLPSTDKLPTDAPLAIFVEQVEGLWEPNAANYFESLVSFAYRCNSLLWVEFVDAPRKQVEESKRSGASYRRKIEQLKSQSPLQFLEPSCLSRLETLCALPRVVEEEFYD